MIGGGLLASIVVERIVTQVSKRRELLRSIMMSWVRMDLIGTATRE